MSYTDALVNQGKKSRSAFSQRFIEFLQAGLDAKMAEAVNYNVVAYQKKNGTLRTDRIVKPKLESMSRSYFENREKPLMMNVSDAQVLEHLAGFTSEHSLDMDDEADQWFVYITEGVIGPAVGNDLEVGVRNG